VTALLLALLALVWLVLLTIVCVDSAGVRERTYVGASLLAATAALVTVLAADALHAGGIL
jgi:hypothetical protein